MKLQKIITLNEKKFSDLGIDNIDGRIVCASKNLTSLEGAPSIVNGSFDCSSNQLVNLLGAPNKITGHFYCGNNRLTSLEGGPSYVGDGYFCYDNELVTLKGAPQHVEYGFECDHNKLTSLKDIHRYIQKIGGDFGCFYNPIKSHILGLTLIDIGGYICTQLGDGKDVDIILNKWKNQGRKGVMGAMKELTDLGYEELAQL